MRFHDGAARDSCCPDVCRARKSVRGKYVNFKGVRNAVGHVIFLPARRQIPSTNLSLKELLCPSSKWFRLCDAVCDAVVVIWEDDIFGSRSDLHVWTQSKHRCDHRMQFGAVYPM